MAAGDEVLFVVSTDTQGRNTATHIVVQPKGTVSRTIQYEGLHSGVVEKGTQFTGFTGTRVQILTQKPPKKRRECLLRKRGTRATGGGAARALVAL